MKTKRTHLPYINNIMMVLITIAINVCVVFAFFWPDGAALIDVVIDTSICVVITVAIGLSFVYPKMKAMRETGSIPKQAPVSALMQKLPKNPIFLGLTYAVVFGILMVGINVLILWFFGMTDMGFIPWLAYKLIYSTILSIKIVEFCIYRYVQPDWVNDVKIPVRDYTGKPVKDPLPKVSLFKEMFGSVTFNIALNMILGAALGGAVINADASVIIYPTTAGSIWITGLIFGFITGLLTTNGVINAVKAAVLSSNDTVPDSKTGDNRFTWLPKNKFTLTCLVCVCVMIFSAVMLQAIMMLFGKSALNFYQFSIFITIYAAIISKPLSYILTQRCSQPDWVIYIRNKTKTESENNTLTGSY